MSKALVGNEEETISQKIVQEEVAWLQKKDGCRVVREGWCVYLEWE